MLSFQFSQHKMPHILPYKPRPLQVKPGLAKACGAGNLLNQFYSRLGAITASKYIPQMVSEISRYHLALGCSKISF